MSEFERFRERAEKLRRLAGETKDRKHRDELLRLAADWWLLAQKAARFENHESPPQRVERAGAGVENELGR